MEGKRFNYMAIDQASLTPASSLGINWFGLLEDILKDWSRKILCPNESKNNQLKLCFPKSAWLKDVSGKILFGPVKGMSQSSKSI